MITPLRKAVFNCKKSKLKNRGAEANHSRKTATCYLFPENVHTSLRSSGIGPWMLVSSSLIFPDSINVIPDIF